MLVAVSAADVVFVHGDLVTCEAQLLMHFFESMNMDAFLPGNRYRQCADGKMDDSWSVAVTDTSRIEEWIDGARTDVIYCNIDSFLKSYITTECISDEGFRLKIDEWKSVLREERVPAELAPAFAHIRKVDTFTGFAEPWIRLHGSKSCFHK